MTSILAAHQLTTDHIRPRCWDGTGKDENLAAACYCCNSIKAEWDKSVYDPGKFAGWPIAKVREEAKAYIEGWYQRWNQGYQEMMKEAAQDC
jgi:hypothetical protein